MIKKIGLLVVILAIVGGGVFYYMWNMPHKKVEDMKGLAITATQLATDYSTNDKHADSLYLNKAIEVSGKVSEIEKNQDGGIMVILATADPSAGIQCAMRDKNATAQKDAEITVKGICSGAGITGVSLTDCVLTR